MKDKQILNYESMIKRISSIESEERANDRLKHARKSIRIKIIMSKCVEEIVISYQRFINTLKT